MAKQRSTRKAPTAAVFPKSWTKAKRLQYTMMAEQIRGDVLFHVKEKGTKKAPINAKDFKKVEEYYGVLFGTKHTPGLTQGVRAAFSFQPGDEMAQLRRDYKRRNKVRTVSEKVEKTLQKKANKIAREKTLKLMEEIGQERTDVQHAYIDTMIKPRTNEVFPVKVQHRDGEPDVIIINHIARESYHFDKFNLADDTLGEIRTAFEELEGTKNSRYAIEVGDGRFIDGELTPELLEKSIVKLMMKYNDPMDGHHWEQWLTGVTKLTPVDQTSLAEMRKAYREHYAQKESYKKAKKRARKKLPKV